MFFSLVTSNKKYKTLGAQKQQQNFFSGVMELK